MASISQLLDLLAVTSSIAASAGGSGSGRRPTGIVSPWQEGQLASVPWQDVFGDVAKRMTRVEAMKIPGVTKARAVLHSLVVSRPWVALNAAGRLAEQPAWLYRSDRGVAPQMRTREILDDHIFEGESLLVVERGSVGQIIDAQHVPFHWWHIDDDGTVVVNDIPMRPDSVVWIPGPGPGLLTIADETLRAVRDMTHAWAARVRTPTPSIFLSEVEDNGMTLEEAEPYVNAVAAARRSENGAVMFVPHSMKADAIAANDDAALFENGRNAARIDVANFFNLPAALLDGSVSAASLTYSTQEGRRNELVDYTLPYWIGPIEETLSLDTVVPRGQRIRFDFTDLETTTATPTGAPTED